MTTVYFLRHGQSLGNMNNIYLGHTDLDLSPLGYKQAELAAKFIGLLDIDAVYSSDLIRAYNTVKPSAEKLGLPIIKSEKLREIYAGDWEAKPVDTLWSDYYDSFYIWRNDIGSSYPPNGESVPELYERITAEVERIVGENEGKTILIATHATPIRMMMCKYLGISLKEAKNIPWVTNASVTGVRYNDDGTFDMFMKGFEGYLGKNTSKLSSKI